MKLDAAISPASLAEVPALAVAAEQLGLDALWTSETQHDPFLPLVLAAEHTTRLKLGTAVAIGFARSPTVLAHTAWDLAAQSGGRFMLGLGTQVKPHIGRRFGMPWPESPVGKLRELVLAVRAVWQTWQTGERLNFRGEHYKLTLMTPFFSPGAIDQPNIPIYLAGVNTGLARLAGEVADGFHAHPFHTPDYLRQVVRPALAAGAAQAGREVEAVQVSGSVFVICNEADRAFARQQVAFYASTPSYRAVLEHHGWGQAGETLSDLARRGRWDAMGDVITDDMLQVCAVEAAPEQLGTVLRTRYAGLLDRVTPYRPFAPASEAAFWQAVAHGWPAV